MQHEQWRVPRTVLPRSFLYTARCFTALVVPGLQSILSVRHETRTDPQDGQRLHSSAYLRLWSGLICGQAQQQ